MAPPDDAPTDHDTASTADEVAPPPQHLVDDEVLVEEISIDGMCGVY